jgi:DNA-binding NarL/FixJ family response regulator
MAGRDAQGVSTSRVVLADDHPCYRQGLAKLLMESGVEVVAEAGNGWAALKAVQSTSPDVVVLDLSIPGPSGAEVTRRLTQRIPPQPVIVLSVSAEEEDVRAALLAGASGYFLKDGPVEDVVAGIRAAARGESHFSPRIASVLLRRVRACREAGARRAAAPVPEVSLSRREREVLTMVVEGRSNSKIGERLDIDTGTARHHVSRILAKLEVDNRVQAAVRAVREGLV